MKIQIALVVLLSLLTGAAGADVMVVRSVHTEAMAGMGGAPKEHIQWTSGDRQREEHKSEGKASLMERMAGMDRPTITRLDKKVRWTLNAPKKSYEESPLVAPIEKSTNDDSGESDQTTGPEEKPTTRISKAEFKVTPLNKKKTIGAFACEGFELRTLLETEDLQTHEKSEMKMVSTLWTTPETGPVAQLKKDEVAYASAYAKAIGLTPDVKSDLKMLGTTFIAAMAGSGERELSKALAGIPTEMKKIKGYPISTRVEWYSNETEGVESASSSDEESRNTEIPTDLSGAFGNLAAGLAKKKVAEKKPLTTKDGRLVFAMTTEIKTISTGPIPADTFEVPPGFKKKN